MKLIEILRTILYNEKIIVIHDDNEIYEDLNNVHHGGDKYRVLMNYYDENRVKIITFSDSRKAILIYID